MLSADSVLLGCLSLSVVRTDCSGVFCIGPFLELTLACVHKCTHNTSPTFCWVLLKKTSSRKGLCISAFKDLWVSIYETLLNRFFGEQSVIVPYISELSHIWLLSGYWKSIIDFCELKKEQGKQKYSLRHLGVMEDWNWFLQLWLSINVPTFCS